MRKHLRIAASLCIPLLLLAVAPSSSKPSLKRGAWREPVLVSSNEAHREMSLALSPKDPNLMIACAPSGVPNRQYNQSYFHISRDGGRKWEFEDVEGGQTDTRNYFYEGGDCDVAFDNGGTMYVADTWLGNLSVGHSTDAGETWSGTAISASGLVVDRPWLVGGPKGTLHVSYQDVQFGMPSAIWYTRSTDFGQTFTPTSLVASAGPDGIFTWQGNLVVSKDAQDLYLVYSRRQGPVLNDLDAAGPETLWAAVSHDGGFSWTSKLIAAMPNPVSYLYPSIAMDPKGNLHIVFSSRTEKDRPIWYAFSKDEAESWTKPLPLTRGSAGYSPWIATDRSGEAAVVWYGGPHPKTAPGKDYDWFIYWARVSGAGAGKPHVVSGTTTDRPIFTGNSLIPEFENVRLDAKGVMHIGASARYQDPVTKQIRWALYYQRER
ncbi:MAG TPA: sialidase family protein [Actinomycetota bacterium]|nr:sialidase family protein [Actinomycetota bacterium]